MRTDLLEQKEQILQWVAENKSKAFMAQELHCNPKTITSLLAKMGIEYSGNKSGKGMTKQKNSLSLLEYLATSSDI